MPEIDMIKISRMVNCSLLFKIILFSILSVSYQNGLIYAYQYPKAFLTAFISPLFQQPFQILNLFPVNGYIKVSIHSSFPASGNSYDRDIWLTFP